VCLSVSRLETPFWVAKCRKTPWGSDMFTLPVLNLSPIRLLLYLGWDIYTQPCLLLVPYSKQTGGASNCMCLNKPNYQPLTYISLLSFTVGTLMYLNVLVVINISPFIYVLRIKLNLFRLCFGYQFHIDYWKQCVCSTCHH
jgi:hypothetical protein